MSKRAGTSLEKSNEKNPLLKLVDVITINGLRTYIYTHHSQWDELEKMKDPMNIFSHWYNDNNKEYNHIKHAFNSLCKHYSLILIKEFEISLNNNKITKIWTMKTKKDHISIYQINNKKLNLIAVKNGIVPLEIKDDEIKTVKDFLENYLCKCA
jgi:hypothetical protein